VHAHNTGVLFPMLTGALVVYLLAVRALPVAFLKPWIASHVILVLCFAPWMRVILLQSHSVMPEFWIPKTTPRWAYLQFIALYPVPKLFKPLLYALMLWGCYNLRRQPHLLAFVLVFFVGQPLLLLALSLLQPVLIIRAMVWSTAFACIPMAVGLLALLPRLRPLGVTAATAAVALAQVTGARAAYPAPRKEPIAAFVAPLSEFRPDRDALIVAPETFAWTLWYQMRHTRLARAGYALRFGDRPFQLRDWLGVTLVKRAELVGQLKGKRAWFLHETAPLYPPAPGDGFEGVTTSLNGWGKPARTWHSQGFELVLYERTAAPPAGDSAQPCAPSCLTNTK
jgi:hypothetical protein